MANKEKEIYERVLREGDEVSLERLSLEFSTFFKDHTIGLPSFKPPQIDRGSKSNKDVYNKMFSDINEDLKCIYESYNDAERDYLNIVANNDINTKKLNEELDKILLRTKNFNTNFSSNTHLTTKTLTFNNLKNVNTKNRLENNIPKSTCEIDFEDSTVRNELHSTPNDKVLLNSTNISYSCNLPYDIIGDINNLLNDLNTEAVKLTCKSSTIQNISASLVIDCELKNSKYISKIELLASSIYNSDIDLYTSNDGTNFIKKVTNEFTNKVVWRFNKELVKAIKIIINKNEADIVNGEDSYYHFLLQNLSLYNDKYSDNSALITNVIEFDSTFSNLTLLPDHKKPSNTNISYFIGYENKENKIVWRSIEPGIPYDLELLNRSEILLNYTTSEKFGEIGHSGKNDFFYLHELPSDTNKNSIYIRSGYAQWLVEELALKDDKKNSPDIKDYKQEDIIHIAPLEATETNIKCTKTNNYFIISQNIICEDDIIIQNRYIKFAKENETFEYLVFINGRQVFENEGLFAFKLLKGENIIKIMFLLKGLNISNYNNIKTINHNFNLMTKCKNIYAGPKMHLINSNTLMTAINNYSLRHYSIYNENDKQYIIAKYNPNYVLTPTDALAQSNNMDICINTSEYFRGHIKYNHMTEEVKKSITNADNNSNIRIRLMAKLTSLDKSVTPFINSIRLVTE